MLSEFVKYLAVTLGFAFVAGLAVGVYVNSIPDVYKATARIRSAGDSVTEKQILELDILAKRRVSIFELKRKFGLKDEDESIKKRIEIRTVDDFPNLVEIVFSSDNPKSSRGVANQIAIALIDESPDISPNASLEDGNLKNTLASESPATSETISKFELATPSYYFSDPAITPGNPSGPRRGLMILIASFGGLALGAVISIGLSVRNRMARKFY